VNALGSPSDKRDILIEARNRLPFEHRSWSRGRSGRAWVRRWAIAGAIAVTAIAVAYATTHHEPSVSSARSNEPPWLVDWRTGLVCPAKDVNGDAIVRCQVNR
jgi:hypothetical protein